MSIDHIWKKYKSTKNPDLKNKLIENYVDLVRIVAGRMYNFYGSKIEFDDLLGYGVLGLIDSIDKFELDRDVKFETYAQIRIRGEIIDNIRKTDWVPRLLRKKAKEIKDVTYKLENKLNRKPSNSEIAAELEISLTELEKNLSDMVGLNMSSLEDMLIDSGDYIMDNSKSNIKTPEEIYEEKNMKKLLSDSIDELKEREKLVISLYYYEELNYKEIGDILDLSESRISQIHGKAIKDMKKSLKNKDVL